MILIVAATERELCGRAGLVCGVGPVEAAATVARALALDPPSAVLHVGIAGARGDSGLAPPRLVVGESAVYEDLVRPNGLAERVIVPAAALLELACRALPGAAVLPIGTTGWVGGASECPVEAMEGFAVLCAAAAAGVPAVEIRAISNLVEDPRATWRVEEALVQLDRAVGALLAALASDPIGRG